MKRAPVIRRLGRSARELPKPNWIPAYVRGMAQARMRERRLRIRSGDLFSLADYSGLVRSLEAAICELFPAAAGRYADVIAGGWRPAREPDDETDWRSREVLLTALTAVDRLLEPATAVEVGVERGHSSAVILAGMHARGAGRLLSIDLPRLGAPPGFVGRVIPPEFRDRWSLTLGPSGTELPGVLRQVEAVDLFLHDGDHAYASQLEDLHAVWEKLAPGGVIVVDDVWSPAVVDFGREVGQAPRLVQRWDEHDAIALLRRPAA